ncbi:Hypothetical predicted protein, partial [Olea europaea subsp. europaea]
TGCAAARAGLLLRLSRCPYLQQQQLVATVAAAEFVAAATEGSRRCPTTAASAA